MSDRLYFLGQMWRGGRQSFLEIGEGVAQISQTEAVCLSEGSCTFRGKKGDLVTPVRPK